MWDNFIFYENRRNLDAIFRHQNNPLENILHARTPASIFFRTNENLIGIASEVQVGT